MKVFLVARLQLMINFIVQSVYFQDQPISCSVYKMIHLRRWNDRYFGTFACNLIIKIKYVT